MAWERPEVRETGQSLSFVGLRKTWEGPLMYWVLMMSSTGCHDRGPCGGAGRQPGLANSETWLLLFFPNVFPDKNTVFLYCSVLLPLVPDRQNDDPGQPLDLDTLYGSVIQIASVLKTVFTECEDIMSITAS